VPSSEGKPGAWELDAPRRFVSHTENAKTPIGSGWLTKICVEAKDSSINCHRNGAVRLALISTYVNQTLHRMW
jgi:hypothetical protein